MQKSELKLYMLNVGHGDSLILDFPSKDGSKRLYGLIDVNTKRGESVPEIKKWMKINGINEIEFICLTHPHSDHYTGLSTILDECIQGSLKVNEFWDCGLSLKHAFYLNSNDAFKRTELVSIYDKIKTLSIRRRSQKHFDRSFYSHISENLLSAFRDFGRMKLYVLSPAGDTLNQFSSKIDKYLETKSGKKPNPSESANMLSVALLIIWGDVGIILGSDLPEVGWKIILERIKNSTNEELNSIKEFKLIKVSHHGSSLSQSESFLKNIFDGKEKIAFISGGEKRGLPSAETLKLYSRLGFKVYCTNLSPHCFSRVSVPNIKRISNQKVSQALDSISSPIINLPYQGFGSCLAEINDSHKNRTKIQTQNNLHTCLYRDDSSCIGKL